MLYNSKLSVQPQYSCHVTDGEIEFTTSCNLVTNWLHRRVTQQTLALLQVVKQQNLLLDQNIQMIVFKTIVMIASGLWFHCGFNWIAKKVELLKILYITTSVFSPTIIQGITGGCMSH